MLEKTTFSMQGLNTCLENAITNLISQINIKIMKEQNCTLDQKQYDMHVDTEEDIDEDDEDENKEDKDDKDKDQDEDQDEDQHDKEENKHEDKHEVKDEDKDKKNNRDFIKLLEESLEENFEEFDELQVETNSQSSEYWYPISMDDSGKMYDSRINCIHDCEACETKKKCDCNFLIEHHESKE